jgi:hypothetical protein
MGIPALHGTPTFPGVERRRHTVLVTRNTEYHCRDGRCLAVRDRHTGQISTRHGAVGLRMTGGIRYARGGGIDEVSPPEDLRIGEQLCFSSFSEHDEAEAKYEVVTSPLVTILRPPKEVLALYKDTA